VRITRIQIGRWRNLSGLTIDLDSSSDFVCLVGENGAGKSHLLELLAFAAPRFGLGDATVKRPFPHQLEEEFEIAVTLDVSDNITADSLTGEGMAEDALANWDGTLTFSAKGERVEPGHQHDEIPFPYAGGSSSPTYRSMEGVIASGVIDPQASRLLGQQAVGQLQERSEVLHLYIDADRVFPELSITDAEILERARQVSNAPQVMRQQAAQATQNLYIEWMRSLLADQQRRHQDFVEEVRKAQLAGNESPRLTDPLDSYRESLNSVLPHLEFVRLHPSEHRLIYNSAGHELPYEQLSGGERELAFLVGQMERFGIKDGLFLLDEPELHLNAELLQRWLGFLRSSISSGQVWIATHSLEAVEAAGLTATLVLERAEDRTVRRVQPINERPILATLAPLLGTPAFSIAASTFVLVEGTRAGRERERFVQVTGANPAVHFMEAGGCREVAARFAGLKLLSSEAEQLRVGAVIDRDHRSEEQVESFRTEHEVFVLPVHEIENFYLHPALLDALISQHDGEGNGHSLLVAACDHGAGLWIWERVVFQQEWEHIPGRCLEIARSLDWQTIEADRSAAAGVLLGPLDQTDFDQASPSQRRAAVAGMIKRYGELREDRDALWKEICGKEALDRVAVALGFTNAEALESRAFRMWRRNEVARSEEADALLAHIEGLALLGSVQLG
jgi:predicted ATPase